jgi:hypothetical protein
MTALARPSIYSSVCLPIVALVLCVLGVYRAVLLPTERAFWLSYLAGMLAYGASLIGVRLFFFVMSYGSWDPAQDRFVETIAWKALHGEVPRTNLIINGYSLFDLISFTICLHVALAMLLSAVTAYVARYVTRVQGQCS